MSLAWLLLCLPLAEPAVVLSDCESQFQVRRDGEAVQPGSRVERSQTRARSGRYSVQVHYEFAPVQGRQYVGFGADLVIPLRIGSFSVAVHGDGSRQTINLRLADRSGEIHQFALGAVTHHGWRTLTCPIADGGLFWGGDGNGRLDPPLTLNLLLVDAAVRPATGDLWFDDLGYEPLQTTDPVYAEPLALPAPNLAGEGLQPGSRLTAAAGGYRLDYAFTAGADRQNLALIVDQPIAPRGSVAAWVLGDGGGQRLRYQILDAGGETFQLTWGEVAHRGWLRCEAPLATDEHWGGDGNGRLDPPLRLHAIICDRARPGSGTWRLRDVTSVPARGEPVPLRLIAERCDGPAPRPGGLQIHPASQLAADPAVKFAGAASWRLDYTFVKAPGLQYVEIPLTGNLGADPRPVRLQVRGDGSRNGVRLRLADSSGEYFQYDLGTLASRDWVELTCDPATNQGHWGGDNNGRLDGAVNFVSVLLDSDVEPSTGSMWLDQVALERLAPAAEAISCRLESDPPRTWVGGERDPLRWTVHWEDQRADAPATGELPVRLVVQNAAGEVVARRAATVPLAAGVGRSADLTLPTDTGLGYHTVTLAWQVADDFGLHTTAVARLPEPPPAGLETNVFGACLHYAQRKGQVPLNYQLLRRAGGRWARDEYAWSAVERQKGVYTFPEYNDHYLRQARANGVEPFIIFDYGNPLYDGGQSPASDEAQTAFANYAAAMVKQYRGVCRYWEVYNEPNISFWKPRPDVAAYTRLLKKTYAACKAADPDCLIVGICTAGTDLAFIEGVLKNGGGPFMDALSVHPYRYPRSPEASGFVAELERLHALMVQYGIGDKPVWLTEIGWPNQLDRRGATEEQSAAYLIRMVSLARSLPYVGPVMWYDLQNDGTDPLYNENNFGLIRLDYTPKRPYVAAAMLNRAVAAKRFVNSLSPAPPLHAHEYEGAGGERSVILWSTPTPTTVVLALDAPSVELAWTDGRIEQRPVTGGLLTLELGEQPVFVNGRFASPRLLPTALGLSLPATAWPGDTLAAGISLANATATPRQPELRLALPAGWTADPAPRESLAPLAARTLAVPVRVPAGAAPGEYTISVQDQTGGLAEAVVTIAAPLSVRLLPALGEAGLGLAAMVRNLSPRAVTGATLAVGDLAPQPIPPLAPDAAAEVRLAGSLEAPRETASPVRVVLAWPGGGRASLAQPLNGWLLPRLAAVTPDGRFDEWAAVPPVPVKDWQGIDNAPAPADEADLAATVQVAWTAAGLALAARVTDDRHAASQTEPDQGWQDDGLQVAVDPEHEQRTERLARGFHEVGLHLGERPVAWRYAPDPRLLPAAVVGARREGATTWYEALLPWAEVGVANPAPGLRLGFGLVVNERDQGGREGWLQLFGGIGWAKRPLELGTVVLGP